MSIPTTVGFGTVTPAASVNLVASTSANSASPPDKADSITIIVSIIGAVLTLASVVVAVLQYRSQAHRRLDVERDGRSIEMNPQRAAQEAEGTPPS